MPAHKHTLDSSEAKPTKRAKKGHAGERKLALDELEWKEVDMPDRLDDVEGFFGLEEIEGVDVAVEGGKVEYKVSYNCELYLWGADGQVVGQKA